MGSNEPRLTRPGTAEKIENSLPPNTLMYH